ncbi:MAG: divergent polysaccharide deacetylase family protein [Pseudolabrys sp.]
MTETADELSAPLGQKTERQKRRFRLPFTAMQALAVLLGLFLVAFFGIAVFTDNPLGGEPVAHIALRKAPEPEEKPAMAAASGHADQPMKAASKQAATGDNKTVTIIDGSSGKRQDVQIGSDAADKAGPEPAPMLMTGIDQRLLEKSRYGLIPVVADGLKPFTVYAAEADRAKAAKMPVIAIVVGGLGVGAAKTTDAIMKLPPAVTLAFTPYGADPSKLAERARAQRHEILLQIPMEPFDYPDNDPGPQTLLTSLTSEQNIDRLHWLMSRFQGYVGLMSYMGARFTASEQGLAPVLRDAAQRGLIYVDDGSSSRSIAGQLAGAHNLPFARTDIVLDTVPTPVEIDRALARLEMKARDSGVAVGFATAQPATIARIADWAKKVEARGIFLVPITMVAIKAKSS